MDCKFTEKTWIEFKIKGIVNNEINANILFLYELLNKNKLIKIENIAPLEEVRTIM